MFSASNLHGEMAKAVVSYVITGDHYFVEAASPTLCRPPSLCFVCPPLGLINPPAPRGASLIQEGGLTNPGEGLDNPRFGLARKGYSNGRVTPYLSYPGPSQPAPGRNFIEFAAGVVQNGRI